MEGEGVEHPDRGPLGRRRQGPRRTERCALQTPRPGLILATSGAGGTLGRVTPLLWQKQPRTRESSRALLCTAGWFSKAGGNGPLHLGNKPRDAGHQLPLTPQKAARRASPGSPLGKG